VFEKDAKRRTVSEKDQTLLRKNIENYRSFSQLQKFLIVNSLKKSLRDKQVF
jgi:hypothetical protein